MADIRWKDKPQLVALAGTELLAATSVDGGAKVGGGTIAPNADLPISIAQILDAAADAADAAITAATAIVLASARSPNILTNADIISGVLTPTATTDLIRITAMGAALEFANPSATPADGDGFVVYIEDNATTRALTFGTKYADSEFAVLPTATTAGKRHRVGFEYHAGDDMMYCMYAQVEP